MSLYLDYPEFFNQPLTLNKLARRDPVRVFRQFFREFDLSSYRNQMSALLETALLGDFHYFEEPHQRDDVAFFMKLLEECVEAAWVLAFEGEKMTLTDEKIAEERTAPDELLSYIIRMTQPERVFLLPSQVAESGERYRDLLIVMPKDIRKSFSELDTIIELCKWKTETVYISIYHSAQWQEYVINCYPFYACMNSEEHVVYTAPGASELPRPDTEQLQQRVANAAKIFSAGHNKALNMLQTADVLIKEKKTALAAFMLQQAVELSIRGLILAWTGIECKTHSIRVLKKHLGRYAPQLCRYLPGGTEEEDKLLRILESAYLDGRYKEHYEVLPEALEVLRNRIHSLLDASVLAFEELCKRAEG